MLEPITYQDRFQHYQIVAFQVREPLLLTGFSIADIETWNRIGRIEVTAHTQFQLLNISRHALDILNRARKEPEQSINLVRRLFLGRLYGHALCLIDSPIQLRFYSDHNHPESLIEAEIHGFTPPRDYEAFLQERIDLNWMLQTQERVIPPYERIYRFPLMGTILSILVRSAGQPALSYGNGWTIEDIQPTKIESDWWYFDTHSGFQQRPGEGRTMLDTTRIANVAVEIPETSEHYSQVIVEQAIVQNWRW